MLKKTGELSLPVLLLQAVCRMRHLYNIVIPEERVDKYH